MNLRKIIAITFGVVLAGFLLIQVVPYGRAHENPPVVQEPDWPDAETKELARRACFDCHSNETVWPWYSNIAPVSWLVQRDVDEGRTHLNFSEWGVAHAHEGHDHEGHDAEDIQEVILNGEMPPANYLITHPEARLSEAEIQALANGLMITAGGSSTTSGEHSHEAETHEHEHEHEEQEDHKDHEQNEDGQY